MNRKIIMLIGILFCGSFGVVVASEAPVALFKKVEKKWGPAVMVPVALTAEGKKIYDDLIAKYKNKTLTLVDNTQKNLFVLDYQKQILQGNYERNKYNLWNKKQTSAYEPLNSYTAGFLNIAVPVIGVGGAIASDYTGRAISAFLKYITDKNIFTDKIPLQSIDSFIERNRSIVPKIFLAGTALYYSPHFINSIYNATVGTQNKIIDIHNSIVDSYNRWRLDEKEIALIDDVIKAIKAAR